MNQRPGHACEVAYTDVFNGRGLYERLYVVLTFRIILFPYYYKSCRKKTHEEGSNPPCVCTSLHLWITLIELLDTPNGPTTAHTTCLFSSSCTLATALRTVPRSVTPRLPDSWSRYSWGCWRRTSTGHERVRSSRHRWLHVRDASVVVTL